ncbi:MULTISPECIES: hypothetical protein [Ponticoccus]|uniref:Methyltransferase family protein n=1 Tax=Ponticoccus litoralis TaxID=422297 RepID=A0AAW9SGL9_9RHOB
MSFLKKLLGKGGKTPDRSDQAVYLHDYPGGYDEYRKTQIHHNKRKLDKVWADETVLDRVVADLRARGLGKSGICHGARNGFEVAHLRRALDGDVIGTDISDTATQFDHMVTWDFHDPNPEWEGRFDFVYTNSLDQAMEPQKALASWARQIQPKGCIYIEHTMGHSAQEAGAKDPFGAHPMVMPYLIFQWGRGRYALADIIEVEAKANKNIPAWLFVLQRTDAEAV